MGWVIPQLGAEAVIFPGQGVKDEARAAIQLLSTNIRRFVGLNRLGWHHVDQRPVYVHAGGVICHPPVAETDLPETNRTASNPLPVTTLDSSDSSGPISPGVKDTLGIRMRIPQSLSRYALPAPSRDQQLRNDIRCSLKLLLLVKPTIAVPLYCATWYVALAEADFSLHVYGGTGNFKTELTALIVQHFGPELDARHLPANWSSTPNYLRSILAHAGNVIVPVDDFVPAGSQYDIDRSFRAAEDVFRAQGNSAGRGRCYRDGTPQQPEPPRGLVVSTGEVRPSGHSLTARVLMLEVQPGDIVDRGDPESLKIFTEHQQHAREGRFARATAAFLSWVSAHYDEQQTRLRERLRFRRAVTPFG